ncbi:MAG: hypothetical protein AAB907_01050, partial [Patescibacteria group bacterium]
EKSLGERIIQYIKSLNPKEKENDPIQNMVNTLYAVARESLPAKTTIPKDPLVFIKEALTNISEYKDVWNKAKDIVSKKFSDNPQALEKIAEYIEKPLERPFAKQQLHKVVQTGINEKLEDIGKIVKEYYEDKQKKAGDTLAKYLSEKVGITGETAQMLEQYVVKRFEELTRAKKEQILTTMGKEIPRLAKKDFLQKLLEFSNLGAFHDGRYFDLIAKKLKIPNVSVEQAEALHSLAQKVQQSPQGSEERQKLITQLTKQFAKSYPTTIWDVFESYRYQNILSGKSNERNFFHNGFMSYVGTPAILGGEAVIDSLHSLIQNNPKEVGFSSPIKYLWAAMNAHPRAVGKFFSVLKGEQMIENPDIIAIKYMALREQHPKLQVITTLLEAFDQFSQEVIRSGLQ